MVFILKPKATEKQIDNFKKSFENDGFSSFISKGTEHTAVCIIGNTSEIDINHIVESNEFVEYGKRVTEQYKAISRTVHPENTIVDVSGIKIGEGTFTVMSGPCSVESEEQIVKVAKAVKASGAKIMRGGAFKPRSSPYAFQGLRDKGLELLKIARQETGLPIVTEIMNQTQLPLFDDIDMIQIGARNMQNFDLLKAVGETGKPILLKRGLANTVEELLMSAEYLYSSGTKNIVLCERGIRTFETLTRNTLDLSAVLLIKQKSHLPVIVDPSHASGIRSFVAPLSKASLAVGADGLIIETHNDPSKALCDGGQSLDLEQFDTLMKELKVRAKLENREI